ncbi:MAG: S8/S53 family peptidase [Planctomycetes bacterium]|nr:S8/S53 family peptidase [Planctomycetota bacterium]
MRKIVVFRSHEFLEESFRVRSFAPAARGLDARTGGVRGTRVIGDRGFAAPLPPPLPLATAEVALTSPRRYAVPMEFEDEDAMRRFAHDRRDDVEAVFADCRIQAAPVCHDDPVGTFKGVARKLQVQKLHAAGLDGRGVRVAIVDTGICAARRGGMVRAITNVAKVGWHPDDPRYVGGTSAPDHGTMCAFDAQIAAPAAELLDYALLQSGASNWSAWLSDAVMAYADLLQRRRDDPRPLVVSNSWAMFDASEDEPIGSPGNYSANASHPFNRIVRTLVAAGVDVVFCAGNCGAPCPDPRCGADVGGGRSIHGANGHPDVITVAAVTTGLERLGYSSQGPAGLDAGKPDVAAFSQFRGSGVHAVDSGTSASCPVLAGVVAALRSGSPGLPPSAVKSALLRTARDLAAPGFDHDLGWGVVRPWLAAKQLGH